MKNGFCRVISFILAVLILTFSIPFACFGLEDYTLDNPMKKSDVLKDLENMGIDIDGYHIDKGAKFVDCIKFIEYAYPLTGCDSTYYGLYFYIYNPSCEPLDLVGKSNRVNFSFETVTGQRITNNYTLTCLGFSDKPGYEHLYYKFSIDGASSIGAKVNPAERKYYVNSIELNPANDNADDLIDYSIGDCYTFVGYQEGFGYERTKLKLYSTIEEIDVIRVELGSASWFSEKWAGSESDYRYEMTSVYFTIPNHFVKKYGNPGEKEYNTSGLVAVHGDYKKYVTDGVIVPDDEWKLAFELVVGENLHTLDSYKNNTVGYGAGFTSGLYSSSPWEYTYNIEINAFVKSNDINNHLCNVVKGSVEDVDYVSSADFLEAYYKYGKNHYGDTAGLLSINANRFTNLGYQSYDISVKDESLNSKLTKEYEKTWWDKFFGTGTEINYNEIRPLIELSSSDVSTSKTTDAIAENLFISVDDVESLQTFYDKYSKDNHIYLMRFDVNPYFSDTVTLKRGDQINFGITDFDDQAEGTYFEKVIYEDFDILEFTFRNSKGEEVKVPVSANPMTIVGGVVGPSVSDPNNPNNDDGDDLMDWMKKLLEWFKELKIGYKILAVVVLIAIFFVAIALISKLTKISINAIFKGVGWLIAAPFKLVGKGVSTAKAAITRKRKSKEKNKEKKE